MSNACKHCPFKSGSKLGFTQDGLAALDAGHEPGCHMIVGKGLQFNNPVHSTKAQCKGFDFYMQSKLGFNLPFLESTS